MQRKRIIKGLKASYSSEWFKVDSDGFIWLRNTRFSNFCRRVVDCVKR